MGGYWSKVFKMSTMLQEHYKCRNVSYPRDNIQRFPVPDEFVSWEVNYPDYNPPCHTSASVRAKPVWADEEINTENEMKFAWNDYDTACNVDRKSFHGIYQVVNSLPRNPVGRTGITGRGCLGRYGPNHAADPIVTRWKRFGTAIAIDATTRKQILQFVAISRRDTREWAIPGGMVDPGETVTTTLRREFGEEALNSLEANDETKKKIEKNIDELFMQGTEIYRGYVDDPRNTDNAWMETVAYNFHDQNGTSVGMFQLHAGDDAVGVQWMDMNRNVALYASHVYMIKKVVDRYGAHW